MSYNIEFFLNHLNNIFKEKMQQQKQKMKWRDGEWTSDLTCVSNIQNKRYKPNERIAGSTCGM